MAFYDILVSEIKDTYSNYPEIISGLDKHKKGKNTPADNQFK